jgi:hypothetical protein
MIGGKLYTPFNSILTIYGRIPDHNYDGEENEVTGSADICSRSMGMGLLVQIESVLYVVDF